MELKQTFKDLWTWIVEDPSRAKEDWPGFRGFDTVKHECPACEHAWRVKNTTREMCDSCPLLPDAKEKLGEEYDPDSCLGGLYTKFTVAVDRYRFCVATMPDAEVTEVRQKEAVKAAEAIRDLEWTE